MRAIQRLSAAIIITSFLLCLSACGSLKNSLVAATSSADQQLTIPEGTRIDVRLDDSLSSNASRTGDTFQATLAQPIQLDNGQMVVPRGTAVTGEVIAARPSGHLKTPAVLAVSLTTIDVAGAHYTIATSSVSRRGHSHKGRNLKWIGGSAAGGALLGALIGHGTGAAVGALVGGGGGTAAAYATGKQNIVLPSETQLHFILRQPVTISRAG